MSDYQKQRSIVEIMNEVLRTVREYYDSEYVYYVERNNSEIKTVYEWCAENIPWQRDRIKMLEPPQFPKWMRQDITNTNEDSYSVSQEISGGETAILAAVNVHRGAREIYLLRALLPYTVQAISLHKVQKEQEYLSFHDSLTGLLNRNSFVRYMNAANKSAPKSMGILSADINGLKVFNKEFGQQYGDEVVIRVGEVIEEYFRGADVFRLTGDEFLAAAANISYEDFMKNVRAIQEKLDNISLGLATLGYAWGKVDIHADSIVRSAESMMQEEKRKYYKNLKKGHHEPIIKEDLLQDIEEGNFIVCLVPFVDTVTEEVAGAEAVVRYQHKDLGIVNPARYLTLLEETKLSHYLDLYIFEQVCATLRRWDLQGLAMLPIAVRFAGATLRHENVAEKMLALVERYHVPCEYLEVEVSEASREMNQEMLAETSNKIRQANIRVILDHFGTKDSSVSILSIMEFDGLKLDKSLVEDIVGNRRNQIVAKAVSEVCAQLGAVVLAEGVETRDQLNILKEIGCGGVQGALFNKPITIDTFEVRYMKR